MKGLTEKEVVENRKKYGSNVISSKKKDGFFKLFIEALGDPIIKILLTALAIKTIFLFQDFDWFETLGIVIAIFVASFISSISEYGSESAFEKLQEESSKIKCKVKRDGEVRECNIDEIVVDDLVLLQTGDKIPADGIVVEGEIAVDESSLNGEAKEVYKNSDRDKKVFRGTVVYSKEAYMKVTKVGDDTFYGQMTKELQEKTQDSPLKIRLRKLAKIISKIGYVGAFLVSFSYLFSEIVVQNNFNLDLIISTVTDFHKIFNILIYALTLSVTIIVVAVPEGLPMMITLVLSSNMKRMLKNNVLVRKLVGIETAGSLNILFTDKTGTLTKGKLEVVGFLSGSLREYKSELELAIHKNFHSYLKNNCLYNNASHYDNSKIAVGGNITDRAILEFIKTDPELEYKVLDRVSFDSKNKYSSVVVDNGKKINYIKGAPEKILPLCKNYLSESGIKIPFNRKDSLQRKISNMTNRGIRVILLAYNDGYDYKKMEDLTLLGALYIKDDIRKEAKEGVELVKNAGVQVVMISGDNKNTATSIGREVGILENDDDLVITSDELRGMSDDEVKQILPRLKIIARSLPQDKSRLVKLSEELNLVVGMTGDGVNDALALKKADVGFAMGSGTEVAKEASDIVILDDNFISIFKAILYGRTIFKSIRKFIIFQLTINLCAISLSIIGPFIGVETPVTVIQMLWINMIMDTLAGIAFSYEAPLLEYMREKPKDKDEGIINKYMYGEILFTGIYSALVCVLFLKSDFIHGLYRYDANDKYLMTAFFALFIFMGIFNSFNARTNRINLFSSLYKNKVFLIVMLFVVIVQLYIVYFGGSIFRSFGLTFKEFEITLLIAFSVIPVDLIRKYYLKICGKKGNV